MYTENSDINGDTLGNVFSLKSDNFALNRICFYIRSCKIIGTAQYVRVLDSNIQKPLKRCYIFCWYV